MFDKSNKVKQLETLMDQNKFQDFKSSYEELEREGVNVSTHLSPLGHNGAGLLSTAMLQNKPDFAGFLIEKIDVPNFTAEYTEKGRSGTYRATALYLAIANGMDQIALKLINNPAVDLNWGEEIERYGSKGSTSWDNVETPFAVAARVGSPQVIEALYNAEISDLNARAKDIRENSRFFPKHRSKKKYALAQEFTKARDTLLKKRFSGPTPPRFGI